ncbi:Golgi-associated PDZ and coiled-coil motif-containing protein-like isoform X2 [Homarus americanus]|uniref:Golgi-associated PDZ and coiled-coil motif-containing protein-like n=1 Tax=Homarus americanus TaxID=6706 RepID=A0A8J5NAA7_HOMAM|nr:Golgi-associated PDZ and coiled-coil motif-containing protein-like isoform X2 [Homarus americanus]KAG7175794.1 Golgi-associated PDZ and coiled-coil motif-containing protein-like [Homarus americanus]
MAATNVTFRWLDILEKEFDKAFVDLDLLIGEVDHYDIEEPDFQVQARSRLEALSSCFAQLAHKAQTIFQTNAKLEAELVHLRHECAEGRAFRQVAEAENRELLMKLHSSQLKLHSTGGAAHTQDSEKIRERLEKDLEQQRSENLKVMIGTHESSILRKENDSLRRYILGLQGELFGAKLAAKYLDKELAGRIQQIQLLGRDLRGEEHDKLWRQLEAEIHLHRHKTVVRACRSRFTHGAQVPGDGRSDGSACVVNGGGMSRPSKQQQRRIVTLQKAPHEGLGMSITGGREHGVPILISVLHPDTPAGRSGHLYVGDAILSVNDISLKEVNHVDAVQLLSSQEGTIRLEVVYVSPEDDDDDTSLVEDPYGFKYRIYDEDVISLTSSQLMPNGRLSRASVESVRGSTDNMLLDSPRRRVDVDIIDENGEVSTSNGAGDTHTSSNGMDDLTPSIGIMDDAVSHESLNGAAAHLEFHSDVTGSEDEGGALINNRTQQTASTYVEAHEITPPKSTANDAGLTTQESSKEHTGQMLSLLNPQDLEDNSFKETQDSVTESSLSSPSLDDNEEDQHEGCRTPLQDIEYKLNANFSIEEGKNKPDVDADVAEPSSGSDVFNGSY